MEYIIQTVTEIERGFYCKDKYYMNFYLQWLSYVTQRQLSANEQTYLGS